MLPAIGSVLGIDVGWSLKARSSAACRLDWDDSGVHWFITRFTADDSDRREGILAAMAGHHLLAAAFDGPLRGDLKQIDTYRHCERELSKRAVREAIGKLAQSNSGNGRTLNAATNDCAGIVLDRGNLAAAGHRHAIHERAIAEAFPNSFLGLMLADPAPFKGGRGSRSDRYCVELAHDGTLERLVQYHLPGRQVPDFAAVTNHDDRAALICALTALGVANGDYLAVGDSDGWIILPPLKFIAPWAQPIVRDWNDFDDAPVVTALS